MSIVSQFQAAQQWIDKLRCGELSYELFVAGLGVLVDACRVEGSPRWESLQTVWNGLEQLNAVLLAQGAVPDSNGRRDILDRVDEFRSIFGEALRDEMCASRESTSACDPLVWAAFDYGCRKLVAEQTDVIPMGDIKDMAFKAGVPETIMKDALTVEIADLLDEGMVDVGGYRHGFASCCLPINATGIYVRDLCASEPQTSVFEVFLNPLTSVEPGHHVQTAWRPG